MDKKMTSNNSLFFPKYFSQKGIICFSISLAICFLFFINKILPLQWVIFGFAEVISFFFFSNFLTKRWCNLSVQVFQKRLLWTSFRIRLAWIIFSFFYFKWLTGRPFEFQAADSVGYHGEAEWLAELLSGKQWKVYLAYIGKNYSDMGYPTYLGGLYCLFGNGVLLPRLIKALLGSLTCLFVYKLARNNFDESTGRMTGIMAMLVPNLIYYTGLHVKETEMVFLVVAFIYLSDQVIRAHKVRIKQYFLLGILGLILFYFRTVLAASLIGSVTLAAFLTSRRITMIHNRTVLILLLIAGILLLASTPIGKNVNEYLKASDQNLTSQMDHFATREDGANKLAHYGSRGLFLPFMLIVPLPTMVYIADQPNTMMMAGAYFTRNIYAFFVFVALITLYKRKQLRDHVLLLAVIFSYVFVLASSGFALSERFHLPLIPFLLILAAYGVSQMNRKNKKYYIPYLFFIALLVIGWNWFKLAGRG